MWVSPQRPRQAPPTTDSRPWYPTLSVDEGERVGKSDRLDLSRPVDGPDPGDCGTPGPSTELPLSTSTGPTTWLRGAFWCEHLSKENSGWENFT